MMMVETELRPSPIQGVGVFLLEDVPAGALVWRFDSRIDRIYSAQEVASLPERMQRFLDVYSTLHEGLNLRVLCGDHGRHFNHSDDPNTHSLGVTFGDDIAACDIAAGTELTTDYRVICDAVRRDGLGFLLPAGVPQCGPFNPEGAASGAARPARMLSTDRGSRPSS